MELTDALMSRRSVRRFTESPIPEHLLNDIMNYAPWVPNHHLSEPWRFVVVTGSSREPLAALRRNAVLTKRAGQPNAEERANRARDEFLEAPVVVVVIQTVDPNPVRQQEDYASMAMATYNLMLAAWDHNIGSYWNTGPMVGDPAVNQWLGLTEQERVVGFVRMGYPQMIPVTRRTPVQERIEWRR